MRRIPSKNLQDAVNRTYGLFSSIPAWPNFYTRYLDKAMRIWYDVKWYEAYAGFDNDNEMVLIAILPRAYWRTRKYRWNEITTKWGQIKKILNASRA